MKLVSLLKYFPSEDNLQVSTRPYFNHSVEFKKVFSAEDRADKFVFPPGSPGFLNHNQQYRI
ncbi:hypothetical protein A3D78_03675 [Candidatus Gottesmanbacteria bacterium RIFCSPHIGHO2_02_FULL_39_14]|uniref:Uncharacterized protein n=2 Tax=Candidatus Gottesmaniibacteriota TaxID=1752720 RepID=A0A1F5ZXH1_9BACT|nr:MAG: hypothetical protein A2153_02315 [Candidatus Gottesmanbacteria bacterium RBG_16_38_7b]OGG17141.1 MAG: hypothetical protein A3D78_03675 [Candidatus Gottesmanbacteria bacterium RIFCSPHIGHO2_02_FULL_39_14]